MPYILTVTETSRKNGKYHYRIVETATNKTIKQHYNDEKFLAVVLDSHKPIFCKTVEIAENYKRKYNLDIALLKPAQ